MAIDTGIADIVEGELAVVDIIIPTTVVVGNGSAVGAPVSLKLRGERLDPFAIRSSGVLQENADFTVRASDLLSIVEPGIVVKMRNVAHKVYNCVASGTIAIIGVAQAIDAQCTRHNGVRSFGSRSRRSPSDAGPKESIHESREDEHGVARRAVIHECWD